MADWHPPYVPMQYSHALSGKFPIDGPDQLGRDGADPDVLASSFSLKLARGLAQTAGGDLRPAGDRLALVLPRRRS